MMNLSKRRGATLSSGDGHSTKGLSEEGSSSGGHFSSIFTNEQLLIIFVVVLYQLYCLHSVSMRVQHACPSNSTTTSTTTTKPATVPTTKSLPTCSNEETEQEALERRPEARMWLGRPIVPIDYNDTSKLESSHPCSVTSLNRPGPNSHPVPKYPRKSIVLIEYSKSNAHKIAYQVINLLQRLDPEWRIQIVYPEGTRHMLEVFLEEYIELGRVSFYRSIPPNFQIANYNTMLREMEFWTGLWGDYVLVTQIDAAVCSLHCPRRIEDYLCYDSIGAPWIFNRHLFPWQAGNGGFAMRRREGVIRTLTHHPPPPGEGSPEDMWFHEGLFAEGLTYPHADVSQYFSIETIYAPNPLAFHKTWVYVHQNWNDFLSNYCPEGLALWPNHISSDVVYDREAWTEGENLLKWTE